MYYSFVQLIQEVEELKAFKNEQTKKMGCLEHKLVLNYIYIYPSLDLFPLLMKKVK